METITHQSRVTDLPSERPASVVEEFEQPRYSRRDTLLTMFGVLMVMLLGSLDQTIVATALPHVSTASCPTCSGANPFFCLVSSSSWWGPRFQARHSR